MQVNDIFPVGDYAGIPSEQEPPLMTSWVASGTTTDSEAASRFCYDKCNESCDQNVCFGEETKGTAFVTVLFANFEIVFLK